MFGEDQLIDPLGETREVPNKKFGTIYEQPLRDSRFESEENPHPAMSTWLLCDRGESYEVEWYHHIEDDIIVYANVIDVHRSSSFEESMERCLSGHSIISVRSMMVVHEGVGVVYNQILIGFENDQDASLFMIDHGNCSKVEMTDKIMGDFFEVSSS